jgi:hypothetical protein
MKATRLTMAALAILALGALPPTAAWAQGKSQSAPHGTPNTTNTVPTDCAKLTTAKAKDECARAANQKQGKGGNDVSTDCAKLTNAQAKDECVRNQKQKASTDAIDKAKGQGQNATQGAGQGNKKK